MVEYGEMRQGSFMNSIEDRKVICAFRSATQSYVNASSQVRSQKTGR